MTIFKYMIMACGLTQFEAAEFLGIAPETVRKYCQGKETPPEGVLEEIASLYMIIYGVGGNAAEIIHTIGPPSEGEILPFEVDIPDERLPPSSLRIAAAIGLMIYRAQNRDKREIVTLYTTARDYNS